MISARVRGGPRACASLALAAAAACGWTVPAFAQADAPAPRVARVPLFAASAAQSLRPLSVQHRQERRFLRDAAAGLRLQADAARLALQRSGDPAVRELAADVLGASRQREPELLRLLQARGMAQPMLDNAQARTLKMLGRANGRKFDRIYLEEVATRSRAGDIAEHERMLAATEDPMLRRWIERQLPAMRHQLVLAERAVPRGGPARAGGSATRSMGAARHAPAR
ncbi:MAG: DUF4142 domain-containing protein [Pseudomonadota bacterium]